MSTREELKSKKIAFTNISKAQSAEINFKYTREKYNLSSCFREQYHFAVVESTVNLVIS